MCWWCFPIQGLQYFQKLSGNFSNLRLETQICEKQPNSYVGGRIGSRPLIDNVYENCQSKPQSQGRGYESQHRGLKHLRHRNCQILLPLSMTMCPISLKVPQKERIFEIWWFWPNSSTHVTTPQNMDLNTHIRK